MSHATLDSESQARIAPADSATDAQLTALLARMTPPGAPDVLLLFRILALNPVMAERMCSFGGYLLGQRAQLSLRQREIAIQRVCYRCRAEYEWGVHVTAFANAARLDAATIDAICTPRPEALGSLDRELVSAIDELIDCKALSDASWSALSGQLAHPAILELLLLVGWYQGISYVCNVARITPETWQARWPATAEWPPATPPV